MTGRRAISRRRSTASSSPRSMRRTAIRSRGRNSTTSSPGWSACWRTPKSFILLACRWCSPATTMWCRPIAIFTRCAPMPTTRCCSRRRARSFRNCSGRAGATRSVRCIPTPRSTLIGAICGTAGRATGPRIDHLLLSALAAKRLAAAGVDREVRGEAGASDHAPAWVELKEAGGRRPSLRKQGPAVDSRLPLAPPRQRAMGRETERSKARPERRPLLVIDGDSFAHRSYHALPKTIRRDGGRPAGAILGFANRLLQLYRSERPRAVLVGWDTLEAETYRHKAFPAYQSGRDFDDELVEQLELIPKFVAACGFANARRAGYEADDFLAAAAAAEERRGGTVLVASGDRDTFQLASERTTILYPVKAGEMAHIGPKEVRERYGVAPKQVPDFIALRGDPSDRLPGAPGIGAQGAAALIRQYGSLAALLKAGRFAKQAEDLKLYRSIATMDKKAPLPKIAAQTPTWHKVAALARKWQLNQLAGRLEEMARKPVPPGERSSKA